MGELSQAIQEVDPSGTLLIVHTPSVEPFAPWSEQKEQDGHAGSGKEATVSRAEEFTARCSSDTLRLVSPYIKSSFDGCWTESGPDADGIRHVKLAGFDSQALKYVLNILHHRADLNPEHLTLENLAKMAVIVEYLGCHQAFVLASRTWIAEYKGLPKSAKLEFGREVVLWLLVSTVFTMKPIFDSAATMAIEEGTGPLDTLHLPIAERVVGKGISNINLKG